MPVILHVDPSTADRDAIREALASQETWTIEGAASYEEACERLQLHPVDLILCEADLGDGEWRDLVSAVRNRHLTTSVFIVSASMTIESAAQAARDVRKPSSSRGAIPASGCSRWNVRWSGP